MNRRPTSESPNLDCLRALAVMGVFADHLFSTFSSSDWSVLSLWQMGRLGVLMFFVHTSLVLMLSMERLALAGRDLCVSFLTRRAFRIYPLSIAFVAGAVVFHVPPSPWRIGGYVWIGWRHIVSNLLLTQNLTYSPDVLGQLWSLPLEIQMYCLLPAIFLILIKCRRPMRACVFLWIAAAALGLLQPHITGRAGVLQYAPCFLSGVCAYELASRWRSRLPGFLWPLILLAALTLSCATRQVDERPYRGWLFCLGLGLLIPLFQEIRNPFCKRCFHLVAKYSYGIYLSHIVVFWLAFRVLSSQPVPVQWCTAIALSVGLPVLCYHTIEHPMNEMGKRIASRLVPKKARAIAQGAK